MKKQLVALAGSCLAMMESIATFVFFLSLDMLDPILCFVFHAMDRIMGQHWGPCYCYPPIMNEKKVMSCSGGSTGQCHDDLQRETEVGGSSSSSSGSSGIDWSLECPAMQRRKVLLQVCGWPLVLPVSRDGSQLARAVEWLTGLVGNRSSRGGADDVAGSREGQIDHADIRNPLIGSARKVEEALGDDSSSSVMESCDQKLLQESSRELLPSPKSRWSDCGCSDCTAWERGDGHLFVRVVHVGADGAAEASEKNNMSGVEEVSAVEALSEVESGSEVEDVIFLHGFTSSSSFWTDTIIPHLVELLRTNTGETKVSGESKVNGDSKLNGESKPNGGRSKNRSFRLLAVDLLGFGRSPRPWDCRYTVEDHARWLESSLLLRFRVSSFHVVAHSMGCIVALALAARNAATTASITLISPPYILGPPGLPSDLAFFRRSAPRRLRPAMQFGISVVAWYEHVGRLFCCLLSHGHRLMEPLAAAILKLSTQAERVPFCLISDFLRHSHHVCWHSFYNTICAGTRILHSSLSLLHSVDKKVVVIHGHEDTLCPIDASFSLKDNHPNVLLIDLEGEDHVTVIVGRERECAVQVAANILGP